MGIKKLKPITPGTRFRSVSDFKELALRPTKDVPVKYPKAKITPEASLIAPIKKSGGRNNSGRRSMRNMGGGHKRRYRIVDFKRDKTGIPAVVHSIEYDPNRTARIALLHYKDGEKRYIIAPDKIQVGQEVISGPQSPPKIGNAMPLINVPLGTLIHNIELQPGAGGVIARGAGTYAQLAAKEGRYVVLKMPSGETRRVLSVCMATIGTVSNPQHENIILGKAGRNRWLGVRPRTRGVAMNPVDHPMGGGEGRASGGQPRSRTGLYAKGLKTRNKTKHSNQYIIVRRKTK
jgi:large subunit ribosomal protein L2